MQKQKVAWLVGYVAIMWKKKYNKSISASPG